MAGRKVFTSGEILTAADVNSYLMDQSVMVFADSTARSSAIPTPSEGMVTYVEDSNRVEVYDGSAFGPIGGILQVVSTTKTDSFTTTSSSFTDVTGLSASITPTATNSKVLVLISLASSLPNSGGNGFFQVLREATAIGSGTSGSLENLWASITPSAQNAAESNLLCFTFLDSPNTTSSITFKVQTKSSNNTIFINRRAAGVFFGYASTLTLMEVAV